MNTNEIISLMGDRLSDRDLAGVNLDVVTEIVNAKQDAGDSAYLWAHTSGDVILWPDEASSENDDGARAINRWQVDVNTLAALCNWIDETV